MFDTTTLANFDPELSLMLAHEARRQEDHLELIASENYASPRVMEAQGGLLTNKYAEGYPGHRYYGGCQHVDGVETLAINRACELFGASYANVQPHSGSQANAAAYMALLKPGDMMMGLKLSHGGHLTHGAKFNFSGQIFRSVHYGINPENGDLDYQAIHDLAKEHKPNLIVAGFSAYSRRMDWQNFREIADAVGAFLLVDMAHVAGLVAAGLYPDPVPFADVVTTTTHKTLRGPRGGLILARPNPALEKRLNARVFPGIQGGPLMHIIAAKAVCLHEAMQPNFCLYQTKVIENARIMADTFQQRRYQVVSGGTDNHIVLLDLRAQKLSGAQAEDALAKAHITVNKNAVPDDPQPPQITSGLRLGSPALTTRGMGETHFRHISNLICDVLENVDDAEVIARVSEEVQNICRRFPVYMDSQEVDEKQELVVDGVT